MKNRKFGRIVFSDFDGTITAEETFIAVMREFGAEEFGRTASEMVVGRITLRQGVRRVLESIPSRRYREVLEYIKDKPLRPGFEELLHFLRRNDILFVIISGGLKGLVETRLGPLMDLVYAYHAADVELSGERFRAVSDYESDVELVAKAQIIRRYDPAEAAAIGDGVTDFKMAEAVKTVFARDSLARHMADLGKPFIPWNDFFDVREKLAALWGLNA